MNAVAKAGRCSMNIVHHYCITLVIVADVENLSQMHSKHFEPMAIFF